VLSLGVWCGLVALPEVGVRTVIAQPERGRQRRRGEMVERSLGHLYDRGGMRRVHLRGKQNILKRLVIHAAAFNLSLILRQGLGAGSPWQAAAGSVRNFVSSALVLLRRS